MHNEQSDDERGESDQTRPEKSTHRRSPRLKITPKTSVVKRTFVSLDRPVVCLNTPCVSSSKTRSTWPAFPR